MRPSVESALDAVAATADRYSSAILIQFALQASVIVVVSGGTAPTGTVKVDVSNDQPLSGTAPTNWITLADVDVDISDNGVYVIPKFDLCYMYMRVWYDFTSGTGTLTARVKTNGM